MPIFRSFCRLFIIVCSVSLIIPSTVYAAVLNYYQDIQVTADLEALSDPGRCGDAIAGSCHSFIIDFQTLEFEAFDPGLGELNSVVINLGVDPGSTGDDIITISNPSIDSEEVRIEVNLLNVLAGRVLDPAGSLPPVMFDDAEFRFSTYTRNIPRFGFTELALFDLSTIAPLEFSASGAAVDPFIGNVVDVQVGYVGTLTLLSCTVLGLPELECDLSYLPPATVDATMWASVAYDYTPVGAVPIPAAVWLFGTALMGLIGFGKRKPRIAA